MTDNPFVQFKILFSPAETSGGDGIVLIIILAEFAEVQLLRAAVIV